MTKLQDKIIPTDLTGRQVCEIINTDALKGCHALADGSVDVVITDPPYSEHVHAKSFRGGKGTGAGIKRDLGFSHLSAELRAGMCAEWARVCRRWVVVFSDVEGASAWFQDFARAGIAPIRIGAWDKPGSTPQLSGDRPGAWGEAIVIGHVSAGRMRWNGGGRPAIWRFGPDRSAGRVHTTQKPVELMEALVRDFTEPGERVLDPFAGSGTTGVACKTLGRAFTGFERDERYFDHARARIAATRLQLTLAATVKGKQCKLF